MRVYLINYSLLDKNGKKAPGLILIASFSSLARVPQAFFFLKHQQLARFAWSKIVTITLFSLFHVIFSWPEVAGELIVSLHNLLAKKDSEGLI